MICPCRGCKHETLPKQGKFLGMDGNRPTMTIYKHRRKRKLKPNPCYACPLPGEYADHIEETNPMPPMREDQTRYVGGHIMDKSVRDKME